MHHEFGHGQPQRVTRGNLTIDGIPDIPASLSERLRRVEYGDERDPAMRDFLLRISPTTHAERITKPLFVVQGLNDPRVPASESEQMVAAIRKHGGMVWYLLANNEGHGFRKKSNRRYYNSAAVLFLEQFLLDKQ